LLAFASPAKAAPADWHICYLENPAKVGIDIYNPLMGGEGVIALPYTSALFSGDCPSSDERNFDPNVSGVFYTSAGVDHYVSGMTNALWSVTPNNAGLFFNTLVTGVTTKGGSWNLYQPTEILGQDIDGNPIRTPYLTFQLDNNTADSFGMPFTPSAVRMTHVWTGNEATDDCGEYDPDTCTGGFTYADYEFRVRNAMVFKNATSLKVLKVTGKNRLAITVRIDRKLISNGTNNSGGMEIRALPGDRVSVKVGGKKYYSRIVNSSTGKVTIYVPNPTGKQKFTVGIRSTRLNWGASAKFPR
jgi:hypothetical protein